MCIRDRPFTMVIFDSGDLYEFRWDEKKQHIKKLDLAQKHIWSSCTLYPPDWQQKRETWFENWQKETVNFNHQSILNFHKNSGEGNLAYDVVMNREDIVRTVSITSFLLGPSDIQVAHEDLLNKKIANHILETNLM